MTPLFSIIMPTYNRAYVIWRAIQSVVDQTETRWELIVVDDGSTDCTLRLIEEFQDPRIRVMTIENHGPSYARNRGIEKANARERFHYTGIALFFCPTHYSKSITKAPFS